MEDLPYKTLGELHVKAVTPVIKALFGRLKLTLDASNPGVARFVEDGSLHMSDIRGDLLALLPPDRQKGIADIGDTEEILWALSSHFNQQHNYDLLNYINNRVHDDPFTLHLEDDLLFLACCFDDGHNLSKMLYHGVFDVGSDSLTSCGGYAGGYSKGGDQKAGLVFVNTSQTALSRAMRLMEKLEANDLDFAAEQLVNHFDTLADGISDQPIKSRVVFSAALQLLSRGAGEAPLSTLYRLWDSLGDLYCTEATDRDLRDGIKKGELLTRQQFLLFPAGTPVESIWHWFESMDPRFVVGEVMQGIRHSDNA